MAEPEVAVPFEAYWKFREERMSKSVAAQLEAFAQKVRQTSKHVPPTEVSEPSLERAIHVEPAHARVPHKRLPLPGAFQVHSAPYTSGLPDPQLAINTPGNDPGTFFNIESFGDPVRGRFSVGVSAGNVKNADWTGGSYYSELPDRWLFGDAITSTASLIQVINIDDAFKAKSVLYADVKFGWDPRYPGGFEGAEDLLLGALSNTPGSKNSALGGFVGVDAVVELTVSLVSEAALLSSGQSSEQILQFAVDAEFPGNVQDQLPRPPLFRSFIFDQNPWNPVYLQASAPYREGAKQLVIETTVRLIGARGGVNDPNAGYVIAAFQDIDVQNTANGPSQVSYLPLAPNPFVLSEIRAFTVTS
jgi:hypothetical protein